MKHSVKWWVSLLACAAVFWAGLICLVMSLDSGDAVPVQMAARDLTITPVASPDRPDDWRDWYEVRYTLENQSDRSLSLDAYDLVYTEGGDTLYPWSDDADTALSARPPPAPEMDFRKDRFQFRLPRKTEYSLVICSFLLLLSILRVSLFVLSVCIGVTGRAAV